MFDYGFTFDAWLYHPQHQDLIALAQSFPNQIIIVDHVGGPLGIGPYQNKQQSVFQAWKKTVSQLAECENIFMKLGGLSMATSGFEWHKKNKPPTSLQLAEATAPYLNFCIEKFRSYFSGRNILLAKEITKIHETFIRGEVDSIKQFKTPIKGEFTVVISKNYNKNDSSSVYDIEKEAMKYLKKYSLKDSVKLISSKNNISKNKVYKICLNIKKNEKNS